MRTSENIAAVAESVREATSTLIYRRSQQMTISEISLSRILHPDLGMTPYKVQLIQDSLRFRFLDLDYTTTHFHTTFVT